MFTVLTAALALVSVSPRAMSARRMCEIEAGDGPAKTAVDVVRRSTLVVRAKVVGADTASASAQKGVRFQVEEVLKGSGVAAAATLTVHGRLSRTDDFNRQPVPYEQVRPSGLAGSCYADGYRAGGDYLLLLTEETPGVFTPYWWPLKPTNEQLRGPNDPWLLWVRKQIAAESAGRRSPKG